METGKELERACDFAVALKFYFAGCNFFTRLKNYLAKHGPCSETMAKIKDLCKKWEDYNFENEFKSLYEDLLPMSNTKVIRQIDHNSYV